MKMKEMLTSSIYFGIAITIIAYIVGLRINRRFKLTILNPLIISILLIIGLLSLFNIDYDDYYKGGQYISLLLTPATVCLAIPLYQQLELLKKNLKAVIVGITAGVISSLISIYILAKLLNLSTSLYISLLPKSITTAIGISLSEELGGIPTVTVLSILTTGLTGNLLAEYILRLFRIKSPISKGLAIGTSSHALGTSKALELGRVEGAMSSLSIAIAGILTVLLAPFFV